MIKLVCSIVIVLGFFSDSHPVWLLFAAYVALDAFSVANKKLETKGGE